jgi:hypothetical protein
MNDFVWYLPESGVEVLNLETEAVSGINSAARQRIPWIRPAEPPTGAARIWRQYTPLRSHTALCRTFAAVDCSEASIEDFAQKYGQLTNPEKGESLALWKQAIADMRSAVECWEELRNVDSVSGPPEDGIGKTAVLASADCVAPETNIRPGSHDVASSLAQDDARPVFNLSDGVLDRNEAFEFLASKIMQNLSNVSTAVVLYVDRPLGPSQP